MNKRQRKKVFKNELIKNGYSIVEFTKCRYCGKKLNFNNEWQIVNGTCDAHCFGMLVGIYPEF